MFLKKSGIGRYLLLRYCNYCSALSGGERTRLKLATLMIQNINTLILDEPTNHLDIIQKMTGANFKDAQSILSDFTGKAPEPLKGIVKTPKQTADRVGELPAERKNANTAIYMALLEMLTLSKKEADYLASRGISRATADNWQVRSIDNPGKTFADLKTKFSVDRLTELGELSEVKP